MSKPRCYTPEEIREMFLSQCASMVDYWLNESREPSTRGKMEGLLHSVFAALDGCTMGLPGFIVAPCPHESDKEYHKDQGENWFPQNDSAKIKGDIGGDLHHTWAKYGKRKPGEADEAQNINLKRVLMELGNRLVTEAGYAPASMGSNVNNNTTPIKDFTDYLNTHPEARIILSQMGYDWPVAPQRPAATTEAIREAAERIQPPADDDIPF